METTLIQKEEIKNLKFKKSDVLKESDKIHLRYDLLKQGEILGNSYKHKLKIMFHSIEGSWMVYTTVWFVSEAYIQIKGGTIIPISAIEDVAINTL